MTDLSHFRSRIDAIDEQLVTLLAERLDICRQVAEHKRTHGIPMMQPARVEEVKSRCADRGARAGLDPAFVRDLYGMIIGEACRIEDLIIEGHPTA